MTCAGSNPIKNCHDKRYEISLSPILLSLAALSPLPAAALTVENGLTLRGHRDCPAPCRVAAGCPLAVSALSGDALQDIGITNLADITELIPNLQISRPSRDINIHIRGIGPTRGAGNITELSVGVYIDDVFLLKPRDNLSIWQRWNRFRYCAAPRAPCSAKTPRAARW